MLSVGKKVEKKHTEKWENCELKEATIEKLEQHTMGIKNTPCWISKSSIFWLIFITTFFLVTQVFTQKKTTKKWRPKNFSQTIVLVLLVIIPLLSISRLWKMCSQRMNIKNIIKHDTQNKKKTERRKQRARSFHFDCRDVFCFCFLYIFWTSQKMWKSIWVCKCIVARQQSRLKLSTENFSS